MKQKKVAQDPRIKAKHMSWAEYTIIFFVLVTLSAGQAMILMEYIGQQSLPFGYVAGMLGYWALVAFAFNLVTNSQLRSKFERPMRMLGDAAKEVAGGDFSVYVQPVHTEDKYDYVDVMFADFNTMVEKLGHMEVLQNDFIANISHEIRAPVSVIKSYAAFLQNENLPAETRKDYCKTIDAATNKLALLVTSILKLNRIENGEEEAEIEAYDLCSQLVDSVLHCENELDKKQIELSVAVEERALILADKHLMEIIWDSLISNAIKFTDHGGSIALAQKTEGDMIVVTISDTGCGMHEDTMEHIFEKFYQGDTSHNSEGYGLGLSLAVKALERVGGTISVTSTLGKGSTFTVSIPTAA